MKNKLIKFIGFVIAVIGIIAAMVWIKTPKVKNEKEIIIRDIDNHNKSADEVREIIRKLDGRY